MTGPESDIPNNWATKNSRSKRGLQPHISSILPGIEKIFKQCVRNQNYRITITGGQEFGHSLFSRHHTGFAVDVRTRDVPGGSKGPTAMHIRNRVKGSLGKDYFVQLEADHLHIELRNGNQVSDPVDYNELKGDAKTLA